MSHEDRPHIQTGGPEVLNYEDAPEPSSALGGPRNAALDEFVIHQIERSAVGDWKHARLWASEFRDATKDGLPESGRISQWTPRRLAHSLLEAEKFEAPVDERPDLAKRCKLWEVGFRLYVPDGLMYFGFTKGHKGRNNGIESIGKNAAHWATEAGWWVDPYKKAIGLSFFRTISDISSEIQKIFDALEIGHWCASCKEFGLYESYPPSGRTQSGRRQTCRKCISAQHKVSQDIRKARIKDQVGRRRLTLADLVERQSGLCAYCGEPFHGDIRPATRDHVIPLARGGADSDRNSVAACRTCNSVKSDGTLRELERRMGPLHTKPRGAYVQRK